METRDVLFLITSRSAADSCRLDISGKKGVTGTDDRFPTASALP